MSKPISSSSSNHVPINNDTLNQTDTDQRAQNVAQDILCTSCGGDATNEDRTLFGVTYCKPCYRQVISFQKQGEGLDFSIPDKDVSAIREALKDQFNNAILVVKNNVFKVDGFVFVKHRHHQDHESGSFDQRVLEKQGTTKGKSKTLEEHIEPVLALFVTTNKALLKSSLDQNGLDQGLVEDFTYNGIAYKVKCDHLFVADFGKVIGFHMHPR